jgi:hypothetical protein
VPKSTYQSLANTPILGDLLVFTHGNQEWTDYTGAQRKVLHLPAYSPDVVDRFVADLDLGYVIFRPGARRALFEAEVGAMLGDRITSRRTLDGYDLWVVAQECRDGTSDGGARPPLEVAARR